MSSAVDPTYAPRSEVIEQQINEAVDERLSSWRWTLIALCAILFVLAALSIFSIQRVLELTNDLNTTRTDQIATITALRKGCRAGNVARESDRYVLNYLAKTAEVVSQSATSAELRMYFTDAKPQLRQRMHRPELAERDCDALYPLTTKE